MIYILNIETATKNCSVSLSGNGKTIITKELAEEQFNHAEKLHVFIKEIFANTKISLNDLHAVAVSKGPGSYTGLRIGVSSAKGLCYALNIPLIAINTLAILAEKLNIEEGYIVPMIDARRMEVFTQIFNVNKEHLCEAYALIVDESSFENINDTVHLIGDGALKCENILTDDKFLFHADIMYPSANEMGRLSYKKYVENNFVDVAYFEPYYLKDFMLTVKK